MRLFKCQNCGQVLYFENTSCEKCGMRLGYLPDRAVLSALAPDGDAWRPLADRDRPMRLCDNARYDACNWLVPAGDAQPYCRACRHNQTVPDLSVQANLPPWRALQLAQHRVMYTFLALGLPLRTREEDPDHGLAFDVLADRADASEPRVMTGHQDGLITIALAEADDAERERRRVDMHEPYRTPLGHFRHESGHHFWDLLVRDAGRLDACRAVFGDDRADYAQALQDHYAQGAPADWQDRFVSAYASTHPWEDFAETWAHYLHIVDALEMAQAFGLSVHPRVDASLSADVAQNPYAARGIDDLVAEWLPLTFAFNSLNRCLGERDLYPFILSPTAIRKLGFIHDLVHGRIRSEPSARAA